MNDEIKPRGYLVLGEQSSLYVLGPMRPTFTTINGHDPVRSITALYVGPQPTNPIEEPNVRGEP